MVVTVFTPNGIVTATSSSDLFYENIEEDDMLVRKSIRVEGLPHTYLFWDKYVLTYNSLNLNSYENRLIEELNNLSNKWETVPPIQDFMPYVKKMIVDTHIQFIGILTGYDYNEKGVLSPYVYQILGENIRRINLDNEGNVNYNCVYLEKEPYVGKLFQGTKLRNGDSWEETNGVRLRCDLYSISKAIDLCSFMIKTNYYMENLNTSNYATPLPVEITITTCNRIDSKTINI